MVQNIGISEGVVIEYDSEDEICRVEILAFSKRSLNFNHLVKLRDEELVTEVTTV